MVYKERRITQVTYRMLYRQYADKDRYTNNMKTENIFVLWSYICYDEDRVSETCVTQQIINNSVKTYSSHNQMVYKCQRGQLFEVLHI